MSVQAARVEPASELVAEPDPAASPCVGICRLDAAQVCEGCGRSLNEIAQWSRADAARRIQINRLAAERRLRTAGDTLTGRP